jgi:hypothetical protein
MAKNIIYLKDGEVLGVVVEVGLSVSDPTFEFPAVAQSYRVVANSSGPILELVPLGKEPVRLRPEEITQLEKNRI